MEIEIEKCMTKGGCHVDVTLSASKSRRGDEDHPVNNDQPKGQKVEIDYEAKSSGSEGSIKPLLFGIVAAVVAGVVLLAIYFLWYIDTYE